MSLRFSKSVISLLFIILIGMWGRNAHAGWVTSHENLVGSSVAEDLDGSSSWSSSMSAVSPVENDSVQLSLLWLLTGNPVSHPAQQQTSSSSNVTSHGPSFSGPATIARVDTSTPPLTVRAAFELQFLLPRYLVTGIFRPPRIV